MGAEHEQVDSKEEQQLDVTEEAQLSVVADANKDEHDEHGTSISLVGNEKKEEHDEHDDTWVDTLVEQNEAQDEALLTSKSAPLIHSTTNPETQSITSDMDLGTQNTSVADVKSNVDNSLHSPIRKSKRRPKSVGKSTRSKKKINKIPQEKSKTKGVNLELVMEVVEHQEKRATRSLRKRKKKVIATPIQIVQPKKVEEEEHSNEVQDEKASQKESQLKKAKPSRPT